MGEATTDFLIFDSFGDEWYRLMKLKSDYMQRVLLASLKNRKDSNANTTVGKVLRGAFAAMSARMSQPVAVAA